jgi:cytochrome c heme-lyase
VLSLPQRNQQHFAVKKVPTMGAGISKHPDQVAQDERTQPRQQKQQQQQPVAVQTNEESTNGDTSKCPMHQADGSYRWDWTQMFKAAETHGPSGRKPLSTVPPDDASRSASLSAAAASSGCPVQHHGGNPPPPSHPEYNVYSQPIMDTRNQMPHGVRTQMPTPTQRKEISTERVASSIPKGGGETAAEGTTTTTTWTYPSPQQFYNALSRKGKLGHETSEEDMESVVALHNNMNEKTWAQVVEWERQTYKADATPKLLKFMGRPHDLSPKATLKHYLLGHPLPYDRHDWTVLRDDGSTVRYVIDYYYDETRAKDTEDSATPSKDDREATPSLLVDVRPAMDGPLPFVARAVQMPYKLVTNQTTFKPLPLRGTPEMKQQVAESIEVWRSIQKARKPQELEEESNSDPMKLTKAEAEQIALNFSKVLKECRTQQARMRSCISEQDCAKASMDLTTCMGPILCPVQYKNLVKTLAETDDVKIEAALETLSACVVHQTAERALAKKQHPAVFGN